MKVQCPRCQNRPNECFRSRWFNQLLAIPRLRFRWRCMRCGVTFTAWMWAPPPSNDAFPSQHQPDRTQSD
ncbi:hypothetical protein FYK55_11455 [Roseiconus nitratireducens]|uniref:Uncharacterized protein n=1 Tax=Roseiconus nitratireducens TaxID=2605748 RepID=A0A5M6DF11_9BACT|nr:hypothetical protein [Roseiconus nitratireducens]KAA5543785.1 hypothetical protein FYK55_11455 [Roseiconus nitratireducens]